MSGPVVDGHPSPYFGEYPPDFFDFIVIDECHRGGANDESNWRGILEYFAPAVHPAKNPATGRSHRRLVVTEITVVRTHERITNVRSASSLR